MTIRECCNKWLVRLGLRKVLPAGVINAVVVEECGEPLVEWRGARVREGVARRLDAAQADLPDGYALRVVCGYRSAEEQTELRNRVAANGVTALGKAVAKESGHRTGGAVDVVLLKHGDAADCGTDYLEFTAATPTADTDGLTAEQAENRRILVRAMKRAGFVNYPLEWWHYCFGDKMHAAYSFLKYARYCAV